MVCPVIFIVQKPRVVLVGIKIDVISGNVLFEESVVDLLKFSLFVVLIFKVKKIVNTWFLINV